MHRALVTVAYESVPGEISEEEKHHIMSQHFDQSPRPEIRDKLSSND